MSAKSSLVCSAEKGSRGRDWDITELEREESKARFPRVSLLQYTEISVTVLFLFFALSHYKNQKRVWFGLL